MKRLLVLIPVVLACSRSPLGLHAPDGSSSGGGGGSATIADAGAVGGTQATGGVAGTGGTIGSTSASGGSTSTGDLDTCSSDADCLTSCIWVTAPTSASQCTAFYCCGMTHLNKARCDANRAAWASYCPDRAPVDQPCPCVALSCPDQMYGCFAGRCTTVCRTIANGAADAGTVTSGDGGNRCGDGVVNGGEECDLGQQNNTAVYGDRAGCTPNCTRPHYCGDGFLDADQGELCDDGSNNGPPLCGSDCIWWM